MYLFYFLVQTYAIFGRRSLQMQEIAKKKKEGKKPWINASDLLYKTKSSGIGDEFFFFFFFFCFVSLSVGRAFLA